MTNNPTIDGVSRELLEASWAALMQKGQVINALKLRDLLDAPVVERQPFGYVFKRKGPDHGWNFFQGVMAFESMEAYEIKPVYESPPEVSALQSTIAQLQARIAELESGRSEIAGFRYRANGDWEWMDKSPFADGRTHYKLGGEELQPLYTSPPAPVAVVLPARISFTSQGTFDQGWNACLDATAALNGPAK